jgi:DNA-binding IclR family transcriptional regulator
VAVPGVAVPIAISVSGPAARFEAGEVPAVAARLQELAARLGAELSGARSSSD